MIHTSKIYQIHYDTYIKNLSNKLCEIRSSQYWTHNNQPGRARITSRGSSDAQYDKCARHLF